MTENIEMDNKVTSQTLGKPKREMSIDWEDLFSRYGTLLALIAVFIVFALLEPRFLSSRNLINVLRQVSALAVVASGLTICVAAGEFDLSVGTVASLAGILVAGVMVRQGQAFEVALVAALISGILFGVIFGILVTIFRVPSLIATIGGSSIALGVNYAYAGGDSIYGQMPDSFKFIGQGFVGPLPFSVPIAVTVVIVLWFFLNKSRAGRYIIATGANPKAAKLSGINTNYYRFLGLVVSGFFAAMAGIMLTSYQGAAQPQGAESYTMDALAAVFLGMTTIKRGQANIVGTIIGVLTLGIINNGLNMVGAPFYLQNMVRGGILVFAVLLAVRREEIRFF